MSPHAPAPVRDDLQGRPAPVEKAPSLGDFLPRLGGRFGARLFPTVLRSLAHKSDVNEKPLRCSAEADKSVSSVVRRGAAPSPYL